VVILIDLIKFINIGLEMMKIGKNHDNIVQEYATIIVPNLHIGLNVESWGKQRPPYCTLPA